MVWLGSTVNDLYGVKKQVFGSQIKVNRSVLNEFQLLLDKLEVVLERSTPLVMSTQNRQSSQIDIIFIFEFFFIA